MPNFHSLVPGGFVGDGVTGSASVRYNNPGAINGDPKWVQDFPGFIRTVMISGGNPIAVMETPEQGVALWWELLRRYRNNGTTTVQQIINRYGGGQDYSEYVRNVVRWSGLAATYQIKLDGDDDNLLKFAKAMWRNEAGQLTPLSDEQIAFGIALARRRASATSPSPPPQPTDSGSDLAGKIIAAMAKRGARIDRGAGEINIVYVEGMDPDGTANGHVPNHFDDLRVLIRFELGVPKIAGRWDATTRPGKYWTEHPMHPDGAFHIALGQQTAWTMGAYHDMPALRQAAPLAGTRDPNFTYDRVGATVHDAEGVHHHGGYDYPHDDLGRSSAGCLVGRDMAGHRMFMAMVASDPRYKADRNFLFSATVLTAREVLAQPAADAPTVAPVPSAPSAHPIITALLSFFRRFKGT